MIWQQPFRAISASIFKITCAAYHQYASAQFFDFLDLAKKIKQARIDSINSS
ncbi:hypothetical protein D1BOALGB6SA_6517 [Olavius sp. associated proteobacterium Delta 1]|nr:hypothetical protein D1BOALGB6SA_6517 [Olavius sp. associated proteobacterium Delta 1]